MKLKKKKSYDHNHDKYISTPEFNKFFIRLKQANLVNKTGFDDKLKKFKKTYFTYNKTCTRWK